MKNQHTKQAHLQTAQADTQTKVCKRACFSPTQDKNFIFFPALRCFNFFPTTQPTTDKTMDKIYDRPNDTDEKSTYRQHHLYASRGFELRMTVFRKFEVQLFVGSSVVKIPACV
jgi:hypothetical protein